MLQGNASTARGRLAKRLTLATTLVAVSALLVSCSPPAGQETDQGSSDVQFDEASLKKAQESVDSWTAVPTFQGPDTPIDMTKVTGKKVYLVAYDLSNDFNKRVADAFAEAADLAGVQSVILSSGNDSALATSYINQAISDGAAGIALLSVGNEQVPTAIQAAADAGIPVITLAQTSASEDPGPGIVNQANVNSKAIGAAQIDLAYLTSGESLNAIGYGTLVLPQDASQLEGQKERIAELCESCKYTSNDVNLNTFQTDLPNTVRSAVTADSGVNWILPSWDVLGTYALAGIDQAGASSRVQVSTWNGIPAAMELVKKGDQAGTFGVPLRWWGWASFDLLARYIAGEDLEPDAAKIPARLFTEEVLADVDDLSSESALYEDDAVFDTYKELWGIK